VAWCREVLHRLFAQSLSPFVLQWKAEQESGIKGNEFYPGRHLQGVVSYRYEHWYYMTEINHGNNLYRINRGE
jgi:hypothetical protein